MLKAARTHGSSSGGSSKDSGGPTRVPHGAVLLFRGDGDAQRGRVALKGVVILVRLHVSVVDGCPCQEACG